jgi:hypothetical protein
VTTITLGVDLATSNDLHADGSARIVEPIVDDEVTSRCDCASCMGVEVGWLHHHRDMIGQGPLPVSNRLGFRHVALSREAVAVPASP